MKYKVNIINAIQVEVHQGQWINSDIDFPKPVWDLSK